jgi:hypothetical protein
MDEILRLLAGGDRRSIGASNRVAALAAAEPRLLRVLFRGAQSDDPVLSMRCVDAIEKATANRHELLAPYKRVLLEKLSKRAQKEIRWHVAQLLPRLALSQMQRAKALQILVDFTNDGSSIVKTLAMQGMFDLAIQDEDLLPVVRQHIEELTVIGTPAMRARGRMLNAKLARTR